MVIETLTIRPHVRGPDRDFAMQLSCPNCQTAFYVDPDAIAGAGRNVRCAACRGTWFASPADLLPESLLEPAVIAAETGAQRVSNVGATPPPPFLANPGTLDDAMLVDVRSAPPLVPAPPAGRKHVTAQTSSVPKAPATTRPAPKRKSAKESEYARARLFAVTVLLAAVVILAIGLRANLVRTLPQLGSLYAAVGLPVNLRGLEFRQVRTFEETQDGVTVLVIEGEIANITRQPIELPRLRLAVVGPQGQEIYSWSALLPQAAVPEAESIRFRSRLASPPAEARQITVRFLRRSDLASDAG